MSRFNTYTLSGVVAITMMACASAPKKVDSIESARTTIQQVESMPLAGEVAVKEIDAAHEALRVAESLATKHKSESEINNAAYLATKHAQIAKEQIAAAAAKKAQEAAASERQAVVLDAREREAKIKAEDAELKARELKDKDAANQQRIALLEKELADLNAKKTDRGLVLTLGDVLFDTDKATLKPGAIPAIDRLTAFLKDAPDRSVEIEGHTDNVGTDEYNQDLSQRRADAVRQALLSRGVTPDRIRATGKGESFPIASNDSAGGRQQNRRVEIIIDNPATQRGASR